MADVFISYASADRDRAKALAEAITAQGWSVWWDRVIPPGRVFDEVIEEALDAAACVVVLWSSASVASHWVRGEAGDAMRRRILVPALIEHVKIPLEFRRLHAADLSEWREGPSDPQLAELLRSIRTLVSGRATPETDLLLAAPETVAHPQPYRRPTGQAEERRADSWLRSKSALALVVGVLIVLLAAVYVVYDVMDQRLAAEEEARSLAEWNAANAARAAAAQRQLEEDRRAVEAKAAAARTTAAARGPEAERAPIPAESPPTASAPPPVEIRGSWRDTTWGHVSEFVQTGDTFKYTSSGVACRGRFRSAGTGSIRGSRVEITYRSTMPSEGRCTGTVSTDGNQIISTCVDSVCGQFVASVVRQ